MINNMKKDKKLNPILQILVFIIVTISTIPLLVFSSILPFNLEMVTSLSDPTLQTKLISFWAAGRSIIVFIFTAFVLITKRWRILKWIIILIGSIHLYDGIVNIFFFEGFRFEDLGTLVGIGLYFFAYYLHLNLKEDK